MIFMLVLLGPYCREPCQILYEQARIAYVYCSIVIISLSLERIMDCVGKFPKSGGIRLVTNRACAIRLNHWLRVGEGECIYNNCCRLASST